MEHWKKLAIQNYTSRTSNVIANRIVVMLTVFPVAALMVLLCEHADTFQYEVEFIWKCVIPYIAYFLLFSSPLRSQFLSIKCSFLILRYFALVCQMCAYLVI